MFYIKIKKRNLLLFYQVNRFCFLSQIYVLHVKRKLYSTPELYTSLAATLQSATDAEGPPSIEESGKICDVN